MRDLMMLIFLISNKDEESIADDDSCYRCGYILIHFFHRSRLADFSDDPQNLSRQTQSRGARWNTSLPRLVVTHSYPSRIFLHSTTVNRRVATWICTVLWRIFRTDESPSAHDATPRWLQTRLVRQKADPRDDDRLFYGFCWYLRLEYETIFSNG